MKKLDDSECIIANNTDECDKLDDQKSWTQIRSRELSTEYSDMVLPIAFDNTKLI